MALPKNPPVKNAPVHKITPLQKKQPLQRNAPPKKALLVPPPPQQTKKRTKSLPTGGSKEQKLQMVIKKKSFSFTVNKVFFILFTLQKRNSLPGTSAAGSRGFKDSKTFLPPPVVKTYESEIVARFKRVLRDEKVTIAMQHMKG